MIDSVKFATLLKMQESNVLDFKAQMFEMDADDKDYTKTAKLAIDVISFINTIRTETSYMIIGVKAHIDGSKDLLGIDKHVDEAIIQSKLQGKIFPTPKFAYYPFEYEGKSYGVFEFPVQHYNRPLAVAVKMKNLLTEQVFHKVGSKNTEAVGHSVIDISDWLRLLENKPKSKADLVSEFLIKANDKNILLSKTISEIHQFSKEYNLKNLQKFCITELAGIPKLSPRRNDYSYRKIWINYIIGKYHQRNNFSAEQIISYLTASGDLKEAVEIIWESITELEEYLQRNLTNNHYVVIDTTLLNILPNFQGENQKISVFRFMSNVIQVYGKIRKELSRLIIEID